MDQSIWAARGPDGESIGAVVQPLPTSHCIFRAPNNAAGRCWMDALGELYESFDRKRALVKYQSQSDALVSHLTTSLWDWYLNSQNGRQI